MFKLFKLFMELDMVYLLNIQYMYYQIYLYQVIIIQKNYRMFVDKNRYHRLLHVDKYEDILKDIVEVSYNPPIRSHLKILEGGGYHYREGCRSFNNLQRLSDII
jgi:hypothetical protein